MKLLEDFIELFFFLLQLMKCLLLIRITIVLPRPKNGNQFQYHKAKYSSFLQSSHKFNPPYHQYLILISNIPIFASIQTIILFVCKFNFILNIPKFLWLQVLSKHSFFITSLSYAEVIKATENSNSWISSWIGIGVNCHQLLEVYLWSAFSYCLLKWK